LPIEEHTRVHVPRDSVETAAYEIGEPDPREEARLPHVRRGGVERVEGQERVECDEFRDPGVAQLRQVGRGVSDIGGEELLVSGGPRDLLDTHVDAGMLALELRHEGLKYFALPSEGPELDVGVFTGGGGEVAAPENAQKGRHSRVFPG